MRVFILGAGASVHAGYPLMHDLGEELLSWIDQHERCDQLGCADILQIAGPLSNFEEAISKLETRRGFDKERDCLTRLRMALRGRFDKIRQGSAALYSRLAPTVAPGDVLVTFNYDVSLERELKRANKWEIGDGYGFKLVINRTPPSATKVLKLHGSTNWLKHAGNGGFQVTPAGAPILQKPRIAQRESGFLGYESAITDLPDIPFPASDYETIIMPALNKQFPEQWGGFWDNLWNVQALDALGNASEIVIIGYSLPDADERARSLILSKRNAGAAITICCGNDTAHLAAHFKREGFNRISVATPLFADWLESQAPSVAQ